MISQELLDEIIYISLRKKFIDKEFIERIVLDIISKSDETTKNIFGGLYFRKINWDCMIAEEDEECRINADYEKILELADSDGKTYLKKIRNYVLYIT